MSLNDDSMMPPLPTPPYARPTVKTVYGQVTGNETVDLADQVTLLDSTEKQIGNAPYVIAMPSGEYAGQMHQLFIPKRNLGRSASFVVTGQFATFTMLLFSDIATSAVLSWDGSGWHVTGGNVGNSTGTLEDLWAGIGSFARVKNGALQIYNGADGLWHDAIAHNAGGLGCSLPKKARLGTARRHRKSPRARRTV